MRRLTSFLDRRTTPRRPVVRCGKLFNEPCVDCEIVGLTVDYKRAVRTIQRVRDRMRVLGAPMPRSTRHD